MLTRLIYTFLTITLSQAIALAQTSVVTPAPAAQGTQSGNCNPMQAGAQCGSSVTGLRGTQRPLPTPANPFGLSADKIRAVQDSMAITDAPQTDGASKPSANFITAIDRMEEPNAFQKFVAESTGQTLPMFGYNLFSQVPSTFAPIDRVPVPADYVVGPGDELQIRVWGQIDFDANVIVDRNGGVYLPKVGNLRVAGLRYEQLNGFLRAAIGRVFRNFDLNVNLGQLRSVQIFVVGNAWRPGSYTVSSLSTLVNALFASGGPSNSGTMRRIQLKRDNRVVAEFDLYDLLVHGDKSKDQALLPGDVIFIPPVGSLVAISGSVNVPAIYELKMETRVSEALALAGGISTVADGDMITVERIDNHAKRTVNQFSLNSEGKEKLLKDGDLVSVLSLSPKFDDAVTLRGHVANPRRYPWNQGMRVRDLIPNRESLIPRAFWTRHNNSVAAWSPQQNPGTPGQYSLIPSSMQPSGGNPLKNAHEISAFDEVNWEYAVIQRLNPVELTVQLMPFNLGKCLDGDDAHNLLLQPSDTITIFSKEDVHPSIAQQERLVRLEGEVAAAGWYRVNPGETLRQLVARVGGITPQAYLYASEFTRDSVRMDQQSRLDDMVADMERESQHQVIANASRMVSAEDAATLKATTESDRMLIEKLKKLKATGRIVLNLPPAASGADDLPDIVLENGDRFYVPYRLSSVNVMGEVYNSSSFLYEEGKSVNAYLHDAGGASRYADKGRMYILRANGSVLPKQSRGGLWTRSFESEPLMPGDTIMVPEQLGKIGVAKTIKDWTQIFSQFALGAAAINVLK